MSAILLFSETSTMGPLMVGGSISPDGESIQLDDLSDAIRVHKRVSRGDAWCFFFCSDILESNILVSIDHIDQDIVFFTRIQKIGLYE